MHAKIPSLLSAIAMIICATAAAAAFAFPPATCCTLLLVAGIFLAGSFLPWGKL